MAVANLYTTYWFGITDEKSDLCGEEFFTELKGGTRAEHIAYAKSIFPNVRIKCYGEVSELEAEIMGLDTY